MGCPFRSVGKCKDRTNQRYSGWEPADCSLGWTDTLGNALIERLPSPLIVKPMQLRGGRFVALALWLVRELPSAAVAGIVDGKRLKRGSEASFSSVTSDGDQDKLLFKPLVGANSVKDAFLTWVSKNGANHGGTL